jgi:hypothetical protein
MRASVLLLSLALGVPACMGYKGADVPPPDWIAVPPGVADRLFLDRVRAMLPYAAAAEWAGSSI